MDINHIWQTFLNNNSELNTLLDITDIQESNNLLFNQNHNDEINNLNDLLNNNTYDDIQSGGSNNIFTIVNTQDRHCQQFNCSQLEYNINFNNLNKTFEQANDELNNLFDKLQQTFLSKMGPKDKIRCVFLHSSLESPISLPFMDKASFSNIKLIDSFLKVTQSYKTVIVNNNNEFKAFIIVAHIPTGGYNYKIKKQKIYNPVTKKTVLENVQDYCDSMSGVKNIENKDNLCLIRSILTAKAYYDETTVTNAKNKLKTLEDDVKKIVKELNINDQPCGHYELQKIEYMLKDYQITVFNNDGKIYSEYYYKGPNNIKHLYICYTGSHFNVITSPQRYFNRVYYCNNCKFGFNNIGDHNCIATCRACCRLTCSKDKNNDYKCKLCNFNCFNIDCLRIHEADNCIKKKICKICNEIKLKSHVCGIDARWCSNCETSIDFNHRCFIKIDKKSKFPKKFNGFIFFDYEAFQTNNVHVPNLIIAQKVCSDCINSTIRCNENCQHVVFYTNKSFCSWLFNQNDFICIAHNLKGYDGIFIMQYLLDASLPNDSKAKVIMNGSKILSIQWRNILLIDSYSFIPMGLDKFSKTFQLNELKKGFFPHSFNKPENLNYIGPYPSEECYGSKFFSIDKKLEFDQWYQSVKHLEFNFKKEFHDYCNSDVQLLTQGCLAFRKIILSQTNIDPFQESITIASLCHLIFRRNLMKANSIGIIPENGYNCNERSSIKSFIWLKYLSFKYKINIKHAKNGGEYQFDQYKIDGYSADNNTLYEFHGCVYSWMFIHGCVYSWMSKVFSKRNMEQNKKRNNEYNFQKTFKKNTTYPKKFKRKKIS